jgi:hypothetical protein
MNRYEALAENILPEFSSARVSTSEEFPLDLFIKTSKKSKKRRGKDVASCSTGSKVLENIGSRDPEKILQRSCTSTTASSSTSPRLNVDEIERPGGYEHPRSSMYVPILSNTCEHDWHDQDFKLACLQQHLDNVLGDCVGFGGWKDFSGKDGGVGSKGLGGANEGVGGNGEESKVQDGGMVRIIEEEGDRKGGCGSDSSVEKLGSEEIDRTRREGIEGGIEGRVDIAEDDCIGFGGFGNRRSHMNIFFEIVRDKRRMLSSLHFQPCPLLIAQIVEQTVHEQAIDVKLSRYFDKLGHDSADAANHSICSICRQHQSVQQQQQRRRRIQGEQTRWT